MDAKQVGKGDADRIRAAFAHFDQVLGVLALQARGRRQAADSRGRDHWPPSRPATPRAARRDFAEADRIRQDLLDKGVILEDSAQGTRWKRK